MGGDYYAAPYRARQRIIGFDIPVTVFPQSFIQNREDLSPYKKIYVREKASLGLNRYFDLAPDMALGYTGPIPEVKPACTTGIFLRCDAEQLFQGHELSLGDPARLSATVDELFDLACRFEHIVTDRLHFGIAGLLAGREVTLLPNSYFKNRSFYQTWLKKICQWREDLSGFAYDKNAVEIKLYERLAGSPSSVLSWAAVPERKNGYFLEPEGSQYLLIHVDGAHSGSLECNTAAEMIWQLCDGVRSIGDIAKLLVGAYPQQCLGLARDVQANLKAFMELGAITVAYNGQAGIKKNTRRAAGRRRTSATQLLVHEPVEADGKVQYSASLNDLDLWFSIDASHRDKLTDRADPFVLAGLMIAMEKYATLKVEGAPVTDGLLANLEEFQRAWACWRDHLKPIAIDAVTEVAGPRAGKPAIVTFSGGVDSCYTIYRHLINPDRKWFPRVESALMIQGFDSNLGASEKFDHSFRNARKLLRGLPLELISVQTNIKKYMSRWLDVHGLLLGSALTLFSRTFGTGIIANTSPYEMLLPLGSNPVTDPLMGSDGFRIAHHGGEVPRFEKIRALLDWPAVQDHLRVCWRTGPAEELNCGRCVTCVLAALSFRCFGVSPPCLPVSKDPEVLARVLASAKLGRLDWYDMKCIVREAGKRGLGDAGWLQPIKARLAAMQQV
jgi:hypothetical protein